MYGTHVHVKLKTHIRKSGFGLFPAEYDLPKGRQVMSRSVSLRRRHLFFFRYHNVASWNFQDMLANFKKDVHLRCLAAFFYVIMSL